MESGDIAKVVAAVGPVVVAALGFLASSAASRNRHARLKDDAELLKLLPEQSASRRLLEAHIESMIVRLADEDEMRREPLGIALALLFLGFAGWTWTLALDGSNWWLAFAIRSPSLASAASASMSVESSGTSEAVASEPERDRERPEGPPRAPVPLPGLPPGRPSYRAHLRLLRAA